MIQLISKKARSGSSYRPIKRMSSTQRERQILEESERASKGNTVGDG